MSLNHSQPNHPRGQGLIELILAIAIASIGLGASLTLILSTTIRARATDRHSVAINLAREGIEVIRSIRDTNWLTPQVPPAPPIPFDQGLHGIAPTEHRYFGTFVFAPTAGWSLEFADLPLPGNEFAGERTRIFDKDYFLQQDLNPAPNSAFLPYRRIFYLRSICGSPDQPNGGDVVDAGICGLATKIGVNAVVQVEWEENGRKNLVTAEEFLYDWRP